MGKVQGFQQLDWDVVCLWGANVFDDFPLA